MNLEKIFNDFIIDARKKSIYADRKDIEENKYNLDIFEYIIIKTQHLKN